MRCPHADKRFCPLYIASHMPDVAGCDDGRLDEGGCAVLRGMSYLEKVERLRVTHPRLVEPLERRAAAEAMAAQIQRNMALNGIH